MTGKLASLLILLCAALLGGSAGLRAAELVMFEDPSCVWCRRWHAEIGPGYPHSAEGLMAPLRRIDIRDQASAGVRLAGRITATPTFVLADNGEEIGRIVGYPGSDFFYPRVAELLERLPRPSPPPSLPTQRSAAVPSPGPR